MRLNPSLQKPVSRIFSYINSLVFSTILTLETNINWGEKAFGKINVPPGRYL